MKTLSQKGSTLLEAIQTSLTNSARFNVGDVVRPLAVLWTDADGQWAPVVEQLRGLMPQLLTLGDYDPQTLTGPAIWLRCVIEPMVRKEKFSEYQWPDDAVPVIYMPGVSRQTLRAVEECPDELKPMVELQYRGTVWTQKNGRDWTILAFLISDDGGLGLDVAEDRQTFQAIRGSLSKLTVTPIKQLRNKRLEAEDFDKLMIGDTVRDLLRWLNNADGVRKEMDQGIWLAFRNRCRQDYGFDPETDGDIVGGEKLGKHDGSWYGVWERYLESPALYPGIPDLLRRSKPAGELIFKPESWPDENDAMENSLRATLLKIGTVSPSNARGIIEELEASHGTRRGWVWSRLGMSPLANALNYLTVLSSRTAMTLGGASIDVTARLYTEGGYLADDAVLRALASVKTAEDVAAVQTAIRCIYLSWLEDTTKHFQQCEAVKSLPSVEQREDIKGSVGECILFTDGLRFDIGQRLAAMACERSLEVSISWRWSALPTVTATAKPAVVTVSGKLRGGQMRDDFWPEISETGEVLNTDRFRKLLSMSGFQILGPAEMGDPLSQQAMGWTECGEFDKLGHSLHSKMTTQIEDQLELLLERVQGLLESGWKRVLIVTDHGWLLVPGGLPKVDLPKYLTASRWSRCAAIKDTSHVDVPVSGWSWNQKERYAHGPGAHCFVAGQEYAHGGISLQECVVPVITFTATTTSPGLIVRITDIQWIHQRCRVTVEPPVSGLLADLRTKPNLASSSIAEPKSLDAEGKVALLVADETLEGTIVSLVIVDASGHVICKEATTVGGDK